MAAKTRSFRRSFPLARLALALAGGATPETRLRTGLANAGLSNAMAACMAGRMVDRLSLLQLRRLSSLDGLKGRRIADLPPAQFLKQVRALGAPVILGVATRSAGRSEERRGGTGWARRGSLRWTPANLKK